MMDNDALDAEVVRLDSLAGRLPTFTARQLQAMEFPPIRWIVEPFVVEGLTIFAGKPKLGKSWLALDVALAVAFGGVALGNIQCEAGRVLYAALEDNPRRLQSRISQLLASDSDWPEGLDLLTGLPRLDDGGMDALNRWADEAGNPRLIVIDTLAKVRPIRSSRDSGYDSDYAALVPLQEFAGERGIGVILVHHVRKMDSDDPLDTVSGTTGLTGAADTVLVLARDSQGVILHGRGRDIDELELALSHDKTSGRWSILGNAAEVRRSDERTQIIEALSDSGLPLSPSDIVSQTGMKSENVRFLLHKMMAAGEVAKEGRGRYALP